MISAHQTGRVRTSVVQRLPKPRRRVRLPYPAPSSCTKKDISAKSPEVSTVSPHRYTMCHRGNSRYGQGAGRKHMNLCLRPASAILIDVNRSCASCRSFQASTDKILYFQGFAGFHRVCRKLPNFPESIENTGQNVFFDFVGGSSQTFAAEVGSSRSNIVGGENLLFVGNVEAM